MTSFEDKLFAAVTEGVRIAMADHLAATPQVATQAVLPPPAPNAPTAPTVGLQAPPKPPTPAPVFGRRFTVTATTMHGKGTKSEYAVITLNDESGQRIMLKFLRNSATVQEDWNRLLAEFVTELGVPKFEKSSELVGKSIYLDVPVGKPVVLAGLDTIKAAMATC